MNLNSAPNLRNLNHSGTTCQRCQQPTAVTTLSIFNIDVLCLDCKALEEQHPHYEQARQAEQAAVLRGDYNYPGVGKPDDL